MCEKERKKEPKWQSECSYSSCEEDGQMAEKRTEQNEEEWMGTKYEKYEEKKLKLKKNLSTDWNEVKRSECKKEDVREKRRKAHSAHIEDIYLNIFER